jgi:hypothetical protein
VGVKKNAVFKAIAFLFPQVIAQTKEMVKGGEPGGRLGCWKAGKPKSGIRLA